MLHYYTYEKFYMDLLNVSHTYALYFFIPKTGYQPLNNIQLIELS